MAGRRAARGARWATARIVATAFSLPARLLFVLAALLLPLVAAAGLSETGTSPAESPPSDGPCEDPPEAAAASPDLYCVPLVPIPALREAGGVAEMRRVQTPFGVAVTRDGEPLYDVSLVVRDLPPASTLGPFGAYVAWATTPVLSPIVRLGPVRDGRTAPARVSFPKFLLLVTAEATDTSSERRGRIVLRGTSPSMRAQPHELARLMASLTGVTASDVGADGDEAGTDPGRGEDHAGHDAAPPGDGLAWTPPPIHPAVQMIPAMAAHRPGVAPFLPVDPGAPAARPREVADLEDGDTLALIAGLVRRRVGGRTFTMYGFNGQYPGPLIRVREDATIVVKFENRLDLPTSVHWHGVRLDNRYDGAVGVTQEAVPPGGRFEYRVRFPDAGIYWYHPHHREDIQQDLGLYGNMLVRSERPEYWGPAHREEVLMLDDLLVGDAGLVPFGRERATHALMGRFGNVLLVNGEPEWRLEVRRGEVVRLFLTNVANTRVFNLTVDGAELKLVGGDIGRLAREARVETVVLAPAERWVVEARFDEPGERAVVNRVQGFDHVLGSYFPEVDTLGVIHVRDEPARPDYGAAFRTLREDAVVAAEIAPYRERFGRPPDRELVLDVELEGIPFAVEWMLRMDSLFFNPVEWSGTMPDMNWAVTAREARWIVRDAATGKENREIDDWRFRVGDLVRLRIRNERHALHAMQHPIHIHGQRFLVLSQGGVPNGHLVWKDTALLPVGTTTEILLELTNPGDWMLHCHIAEHLEAGMSMVFTVEP